jgi:hypothetical protein
MTLNDLAQELAIEAGEQYDDIDVKAQFEDWVQQAVDAVYAVSPWFFRNITETVNTVAATATYTLGATTSKIRDIAYGTTHIVYAPIERLIARGKSLTASGTPAYWYFNGVDSSNQLKISFQPVPDAAYAITVHGVQRPADLSSGDTIPLPKEYLNAVRGKVRSLLAFSDKDYQSAAMFEQAFQQEVGLLSQQYAGLVRPPSRLRVKGSQAIYQSPDTPGGK